jgi:hypothetical protein
MKKIHKYSLVIACLLLASCDKGFDEMNINPIALTAVEPAFQLNSAIVESATGYNNLQYETIIVKQMINPFSGVGAAGQYNQDNRGVTAGNWNRYYRNTIKELTDVVAKTKDVPARSNLYHMTRIWRAYAFMVLTDTYGDVPYTEAGKSYLEKIITPVYDTQESIYTDIPLLPPWMPLLRLYPVIFYMEVTLPSGNAWEILSCCGQPCGFQR